MTDLLRNLMPNRASMLELAAGLTLLHIALLSGVSIWWALSFSAVPLLLSVLLVGRRPLVAAGTFLSIFAALVLGAPILLP